ncbi:PP2C family protein-serine/threonine phosphatase [Streptomyces albidocamelliae]|uniref:PP2C family protein-serine/threonine phosphatase n=1 Tax=Streptomyces albidocamelliae TaxID=2981135 RepID=UPI00384E619C
MTVSFPLGREGVLLQLIARSHTATFEQLPDLVAEHAAPLGVRDVRIFAVDLQETVLREITGQGLDAGAGGEQINVEGTLPGRAYQRVDLLAEQGSGGRQGRRWWAPVTDGVERLGVLGAQVEAEDDEDARGLLRDVASVVALLLLSKRSFSDSFARLVRTRSMNVAAEMQWNLMPPPAFAGNDLTIGGVIEPAYEVGGDAFDYAIAGQTAHLAVFDAMGHDIRAGITANLAVAACRNARRQGTSLADTSEAVEHVLAHHAGTSRYVTGVLASLDLVSGQLTWVNRGHPLPLVIRGNRRVTELRCPPAGPMGTNLNLPLTTCHQRLEPGDRLLLYTDGITEARDARGEEFGRDRFVDYVLRHHSAHQTLHETLRRLMHAVIDHHAGRLNDDATVLLAEWRAGHQHELTP